MKSYNYPSFQDRVDGAAKAKQDALDNLRSRAPLDETTLARCQAARLKREASEAEKRASKKAAKQAAKSARAVAAAAKAEAAAQAAAVPARRTEAEMKIARDARYAARKSRK